MTITSYLPAEVVAGTDMLIVVVAGSLYLIDSEVDAIVAVIPVSAEEDKFTVPLNL